MQIHFLRHATFSLKLKNTQLLIDPMLSKAKTLDSIPKSANKLNPMVELPLNDIELSQVLGQITGVLVSHAHHAQGNCSPRTLQFSVNRQMRRASVELVLRMSQLFKTSSPGTGLHSTS